MTELKKYQLATAVLAVAVVLLGIWVYVEMQNSNQKVTTLLGEINTRLGGCQADVKAWSNKYQGTVSADARKELSDILNNCQDDVKTAQESY
jgi:hypothetical protein